MLTSMANVGIRNRLLAGFALICLLLAATVAMTPQERLDLDCVESSLRATKGAQDQGHQEASDSSYNVAQFFEGRLSGQNNEIDWMVVVNDEVPDPSPPLMTDLKIAIECQNVEKHLLRMPGS